jgi:hypothetical protein
MIEQCWSLRARGGTRSWPLATSRRARRSRMLVEPRVPASLTPRSPTSPASLVSPGRLDMPLPRSHASECRFGQSSVQDLTGASQGHQRMPWSLGDSSYQMPALRQKPGRQDPSGAVGPASNPFLSGLRVSSRFETGSSLLPATRRSGTHQPHATRCHPPNGVRPASYQRGALPTCPPERWRQDDQ